MKASSRTTRFVQQALLCAVAALVVAAPVVAAAATNPYADRIVFARSGDLWTCKRDGTSAKRITTGVPDDSEPRWSADHTKVIFIRRAGTAESVRSVAVTGGPTVELMKGGVELAGGFTRAFTSLAPTADGKSLYVGEILRGPSQASAQVIKMKLSTGLRSVVLTDTPAEEDTGYYSLDASSDGRYLIFVERSGDSQDLRRFEIATKRSKRLVGAGAGWSARIGPSGKVLCSTWIDYTSGALLLIKLDTTPLLALRRFDDPSMMPYVAVGYSPDGTRLAFRRGASLYVSRVDGTSSKRVAAAIDAMDSSADW